MTDLEKEVLCLLDAIATEYGLRFDKHKRRLIEEAIKIISKTVIEPPPPPEPGKKFDVSDIEDTLNRR